MGRIEDALRRSGAVVAAEPDSSQPATFESPWAFAGGAPEAGTQDEGEPTVSSPSIDRGKYSEEIHSIRGLHGAWDRRLVTAGEPDAMLVEQFRQLAAALHQAQVENRTRILLVTSADPGDGKSLTAVNLALTLSESYRLRVLLIDADLRRPSLHDVLQVPNARGLGETLKAPAEQKVPVFRLSETLAFAPAGQPDPNPMSALASSRMQLILEDAAERFDWVLVDAPPLGPIADATLLAPMTDATLLVVRAKRTPYQAVRRAIDAIGRERIMGVVLNGVDPADVSYRHYYGHATQYQQG